MTVVATLIGFTIGLLTGWLWGSTSYFNPPYSKSAKIHNAYVLVGRHSECPICYGKESTR